MPLPKFAEALDDRSLQSNRLFQASVVPPLFVQACQPQYRRAFDGAAILAELREGASGCVHRATAPGPSVFRSDDFSFESHSRLVYSMYNRFSLSLSLCMCIVQHTHTHTHIQRTSRTPSVQRSSATFARRRGKWMHRHRHREYLTGCPAYTAAERFMAPHARSSTFMTTASPSILRQVEYRTRDVPTDAPRFYCSDRDPAIFRPRFWFSFHSWDSMVSNC